ncbi:MAG: DUF58 domain-containing protein [Actinobacteria bacterium]|nr:DUF58 domain-containing protein [Actinomycetota bacterium]
MRRAFATAVLALAFGLTAALVDAEPLWVPAATLLAVAAGSAGWVGFGARGVRITRTVGARRVIEDEPVAVVLEVRAGRLGLPPSRIADPLMPAPVALRGGTAGGRVRLAVRFGRRGRRVLALPRVLVADPFGLATRAVTAPPSPSGDEILVLPRIEPVVATTAGDDATGIARRGLPVGGAEIELDAIRPLRDGTPASRIFWPALARGADPQERSLVPGGESRAVVVLDPRGAASEEALDAAVRAAASLARALAGAGGCGVLLPGDRRPVELGETLAGWPHIHARLALIGPGSGPGLASLAQRRGPIIFVSARMRARMPQALGPARGATRIIVVPGELVDRRPLFSVAGCSGYELSRHGHGRGGGRAAQPASGRTS